MNKHLRLFQTHAQYTSYINGEDVYLPNVSYCNNENDVHYNPIDFSKQYLTTIARESGTISFNIHQGADTDLITSISYSTDNGETWTTTANQDNKSENLVITVNVNAGDKVLWKGIAVTISYMNYGKFSYFTSTCEFDAQGNVMSLCYGDNFIGQTTLNYTGQFAALFGAAMLGGNCSVVNAKDLSLPATTLANNCYLGMFRGCTSLTSAPALPATTLADFCYASMFEGCTSLTSAPVLPATTLASSCYYSMFQGCTSLVNAPALPDTTLADGCYSSMFSGCTSLTSAPELPATTLAERCYYQMFYGCSNLNYIKAMFTTTPSTTYTQNWVQGVAASGTFVKNAAATWNVTGVNGVPSGWTVQTASV